MPLDKNDVEELKSALLKEKENLEKNLERIAHPVDKSEGDYETSFEDFGSDREDNASEVEQYTDNLPVEITLEKKLKDVLDALEKIEKGTYGTCENCNQDISLERLRANPAAKICIKCQ